MGDPVVISPGACAFIGFGVLCAVFCIDAVVHLIRDLRATAKERREG